MADCYYHGQSSPGMCPECISEGRWVNAGGNTWREDPAWRSRHEVQPEPKEEPKPKKKG